MPTLYHFSEQPGLTSFEPRSPVERPEIEPLVWAIDAWHAPMYYFPRDCPRACFWPSLRTTPGDRERWFAGVDAKQLVASLPQRLNAFCHEHRKLLDGGELLQFVRAVWLGTADWMLHDFEKLPGHQQILRRRQARARSIGIKRVPAQRIERAADEHCRAPGWGEEATRRPMPAGRASPGRPVGLGVREVAAGVHELVRGARRHVVDQEVGPAIAVEIVNLSADGA